MTALRLLHSPCHRTQYDRNPPTYNRLTIIYFIFFLTNLRNCNFEAEPFGTRLCYRCIAELPPQVAALSRARNGDANPQAYGVQGRSGTDSKNIVLAGPSTNAKTTKCVDVTLFCWTNLIDFNKVVQTFISGIRSTNRNCGTRSTIVRYRVP